MATRRLSDGMLLHHHHITIEVAAMAYQENSIILSNKINLQFSD